MEIFVNKKINTIVKITSHGLFELGLMSLQHGGNTNAAVCYGERLLIKEIKILDQPFLS